MKLLQWSILAALVSVTCLIAYVVRAEGPTPDERTYSVTHAELEDQTLGAFMAGAMVGEFVGREISRKMIRPEHVTDKFDCLKLVNNARLLFLEHADDTGSLSVTVSQMADFLLQENLSCGKGLETRND